MKNETKTWTRKWKRQKEEEENKKQEEERGKKTEQLEVQQFSGF